MIKILDTDLKDDGRTSSKGNQIKAKIGDIWYKCDYLGYEGLSEYVASKLLKKSNVEECDFVSYETEQIQYKEKVFFGCKSENFLKEGESFITLEKLFKEKYGKSLYIEMFKIGEPIARIEFLLSFISQYVNRQTFLVYLVKTITLDTLILNEDRHTSNMGLIVTKEGKYRICPIFDNGAAFLSDTTLSYPLTKDVIELIKNVDSKTFSIKFDVQQEALDEINNTNYLLKFNFDLEYVRSILNEEKYYPKETKDRVFNIIKHQVTKLHYLCPNVSYLDLVE